MIPTLTRTLLGRKGKGYKPDPPDVRDKRFAELMGVVRFGRSASVSDPRVEPKDQQGSNACVGFAWSMALRLSWLRTGLVCPDLSGLFCYYLARLETGDQNVDLGTFLRSGAQACTRFGIADESVWSYGSLKINRKPSFRAMHQAHDRRGRRGYYRLRSGDPDDVRRAIASGYPVVGGWMIGNRFLNWDGGSPIGVEDGGELGGHALCIDSYDGPNFEGPGSWGRFWGRNGRHVVTEQFISEGMDLWVVAV